MTYLNSHEHTTLKIVQNDEGQSQVPQFVELQAQYLHRKEYNTFIDLLDSLLRCISSHYTLKSLSHLQPSNLKSQLQRAIEHRKILLTGMMFPDYYSAQPYCHTQTLTLQKSRLQINQSSNQKEKIHNQHANLIYQTYIQIQKVIIAQIEVLLKICAAFAQLFQKLRLLYSQFNKESQPKQKVKQSDQLQRMRRKVYNLNVLLFWLGRQKQVISALIIYRYHQDSITFGRVRTCFLFKKIKVTNL